MPFQRAFGAILLSLVLVIAASSQATNFYDRHGNNFIYLDSISDSSFDTLTFAPVVWDIRSGGRFLRDYYVSYGWDTMENPDSTMRGFGLLMQEAWDHGVNFANQRMISWEELNDGPDSTDFYVRIARAVREDSLNLIAGGFWTDTISTALAWNNNVVGYLADYKEEFSPGPGEFIGVFGFDEPDARYEGPGRDTCYYNMEYYYLVEDYAEMARDSISEDILPFGTFLDRWCTKEGDNLWYRETIPLFCEELEYPIFDYYPCKYNDPQTRQYPDQIQFDGIIGATDLLPSNSVDYYAYADADELFAVDGGWLRIYSFDNVTSHTDTITVIPVDSVELPESLAEDPVWASSDFRASDVGDRSSGSHRLNGAVVLFDADSPGNNMVVFHDGSNLVFLEDCIDMPANVSTVTAVCVGEYNYSAHHTTAASRRGGVIGRGRLRILVCYKAREESGMVDRARIYAWNYSSEEFQDVTGVSPGIELDIEPEKAVWGIFWPSENQWDPEESDDESGFVVIDDSGNYQEVYEFIPQGQLLRWTASDRFTNLFPWDETSFVARQTTRYPCFCAGIDYICHLTGNQAINEAVLEFACRPSGSPGDSLNVYRSAGIELPASFHFSDINDAASCRPLKFYDDALVVSLDNDSGGSDVYRSTSHINFRGRDDISISMQDDTIGSSETDDQPLLTSVRLYNVRQPYRVPVVHNPSNIDPNIILIPNSDIPVEQDYDNFANLHVALDTMFVYGIDSTSRSNCLIHNLRCGGRRQDGQLTFYPSPNNLLYLMTTALVHGCRGIHLRAMDITMMSGNGGDSHPSGIFRFPSLLLNWGPGVETANPDMTGRLFDVVQSLTGKNTSGPDFMSALIDSNFAIMDTASVRNATYGIGGWQNDVTNDSLNFIALEDTLSGDIYLLTVNDSGSLLSCSNYVRFPDRYENDYKTHYVAGYQCQDNGLAGELRICMDYLMMPAYTASLYWFELK